MLQPGSTVYVRWYSHVVQGEVAATPPDAPFSGMVPVLMSIPSSDGSLIVRGCRNVCMFMPAHVYTDASLVPADGRPSRAPIVEAPTKTASTRENPSPAWQRIQQFKADHWDAEHNHLRTDALNDFYALWVSCIAEKQGRPAPAVSSIPLLSRPVNGGSAAVAPVEAAPPPKPTIPKNPTPPTPPVIKPLSLPPLPRSEPQQLSLSFDF